MLKRLHSFLVAFLFLLICFFQNAYAVSIDKIVVFGDSLSDTGNIYSLTQSAHKLFPLIPVIPKNPPYYNGRFSNGPIWIDELSQAMNLPVSNYAYGGSWAETTLESHIFVPFSLMMQVNHFLADSVLDFSKDRHLYVIWTGSNDYINGRFDTDKATTEAVNSIEDEVEWLIYYGAKNFLLINVPDLSFVPYVFSMGPEFTQRVKDLSQKHNQKFAKMLASLKERHPEVIFVFADAEQYMDDIVANPKKYQIKNVKDACYGGGFFLRGRLALQNTREVEAAKGIKVDLLNNASLKNAYFNGKLAEQGAQSCQNPDEYLFWDELHPTHNVHKMIALISAINLHENGIEGKA